MLSLDGMKNYPRIDGIACWPLFIDATLAKTVLS